MSVESKIRPDLRTMVALDGNRVRSLREEAQLTQLYVSKVVGVTTDTISRWENNRYPSIKRSNALRLAEALDVELKDLLKGADPAPLELETGAEVHSSPSPRRIVLIPVLLLGVLLIVGSLFFFNSRQATVQAVVGKRQLAPFGAPGRIFPVIVDLDDDLAGEGVIVREHFPVGWKLIEAVPPASSLDNLAGMARWIIKPGEARQRVVYLLRVDRLTQMGSLAQFSGEVVLKGNDSSAPALVGGSSSARIAPHIWADQNGDNVVDDNEMLKASDTLDLMVGVHLNWNLLEKIWDAGGYSWDAEKLEFLPDHP